MTSQGRTDLTKEIRLNAREMGRIHNNSQHAWIRVAKCGQENTRNTAPKSSKAELLQVERGVRCGNTIIQLKYFRFMWNHSNSELVVTRTPMNLLELIRIILNYNTYDLCEHIWNDVNNKSFGSTWNYLKPNSIVESHWGNHLKSQELIWDHRNNFQYFELI